MKHVTHLLFALAGFLLSHSVAVASHSARPVVATKAAVAVRQTEPVALQLYPNPSRGMVQLTLPQQSGQDYKLRISNIIGREVRLVPLRADFAATTYTLNLSDLPAGMYLCSVLQNDKVIGTKRLVLQN